MGRTRQYAGRVNVIKRIKIGKRWPFAAVVERNGKMVRDHVWVSGRDEHHPEGHYHIEWYQGGKRRRQSVGDFAEVVEAARRKSIEVNAQKAGIIDASQEPEQQRVTIGQAIDEYLDFIKAHRKERTYVTYRYTLDKLLRVWCRLIPSWSKDMSGAAMMINARSETAATKPAFCDPLTNRRCLIPADGFYEWLRTGKAKQPYCFEVNDGALFAFAGLWDRWRDPSGEWIKSCSILTTTPNVVTAAVHDRMPVIVDPDCYDLWLDPGMHDMRAMSDMLKPYDPRMMRAYPVSNRVNSFANDDAECSTPVTLNAVQTQTSLF